MRTKGFTLIELLLVIVILGILIVIALSVINPVRLQRRSREAVLRAQLSKMCAAMYACAAATGDYNACNTFAPGEIDVDLTALGTPNTANTALLTLDANTTPPYAGYRIYVNNTNGVNPNYGPRNYRILAYMCGQTQNADLCTASTPSAARAGAKATNRCAMYCDYNFDTGEPFNLYKDPNCY